MPKPPKLDVEYIAQLARLKLTDPEKKRFSKELPAILAHIAKIAEIDLKDVSPTFQTTGAVDVLREDQADPARVLSAKEALANAKSTEKGFFKVPKVL